VSPLDLAFIIGPLGAPLIGTLVTVALAFARPTTWAMWLAAPLLGVVTGVWLTYWLLWGQAFERVDAEMDPLPSTEALMNAAIWLSAAGCIALVGTAFSAFRSARRADGAQRPVRLNS